MAASLKVHLPGKRIASLPLDWLGRSADDANEHLRAEHALEGPLKLRFYKERKTSVFLKAGETLAQAGMTAEMTLLVMYSGTMRMQRDRLAQASATRQLVKKDIDAEVMRRRLIGKQRPPAVHLAVGGGGEGGCGGGGGGGGEAAQPALSQLPRSQQPASATQDASSSAPFTARPMETRRRAMKEMKARKAIPRARPQQ